MQAPQTHINASSLTDPARVVIGKVAPVAGLRRERLAIAASTDGAGLGVADGVDAVSGRLDVPHQLAALARFGLDIVFIHLAAA